MAEEEAQPNVTIQGAEYKALGHPKSEGQYDAIVVGTGIQACLLGCIMARNKKKVLQIDKNKYYGSEGASISLSEFFQKFGHQDVPEDLRKLLGRDANWCIDVCPKFIMADGELVKLLICALGAERVAKYNEYLSIEGSYVMKGEGVASGFFGGGPKNYLFKVPGTAVEAAKTPLVGMMQKRKLKSFLSFVVNCDIDKARKGMDPKLKPTMTAAQLYSYFGMDSNTQDFVGHSMALMDSDDYLKKSAIDFAAACQLYATSIMRHGKSPYLYPLWGIGTLPQSFARMSAMYGEHIGGTFMLGPSLGIEEGSDKTVEFLYDKDDAAKCIGVKVGDQGATAPVVIAEASYFAGTDKVKKVGTVVRSICILDHPIAGTDNAPSCQIIVPQSQVAKRGYADRDHDVYVTCVSQVHEVASKGFYIAIVSTQVETDKPADEVKAGIDLLGKILVRFDEVSDLLVPTGDGKADNLYICNSYTEQAHFGDVSANTLDLYERIHGAPLDMSHSAAAAFDESKQ